MGIDLVREMFANATKWNMNVVRIYAHTTDPEHAFMVRAGYTSCRPPCFYRGCCTQAFAAAPCAGMVPRVMAHRMCWTCMA